MSFELYPTALGKAILAYQPAEKLKDYLDRTELIPYTKNTITIRKDLEKELEKTRARGYSVDHEEHKQGLHALGVPIFDYTNHVIASVSVLIPASISEKEIGEIGREVRQSALNISKKLGNQHLFEGI
jgi:DNA-binding IclR family transcriptional regulator